MLSRPSVILFVFTLAAVGHLSPVVAQPADENRFVTFDFANQSIDRISLEESRPLLSDAIAQLESATGDEVKTAAERHSAARRQELFGSTDNELASYSIYHDLLRFPEVNRGHAVHLSGICQSVDALSGELLEGVHLIKVTPTDAPSGRMFILAEAGLALPRIGERIEVLGVFTNLIRSPEPSQEVVPTVVARSLRSESADEVPLPDKALWSVVEDRTLGVRSNESGLYYRLLRQVEGQSDAQLEAAAKRQVQSRKDAVPRLRERAEFPVFVDMFQNPREYQGEVVTLKGHARQVRKYPAGSNAEGIETLYETWIYTDDAQSNPAVVISRDISGNLPVGDDLQVPVTATGYFFKIYGYRARDTTRVAPMVLAARVDATPVAALAGPPWWLYALSAAIFLALLIWLAFSYRNERRRTRLIDDLPPDFTDLS